MLKFRKLTALVLLAVFTFMVSGCNSIVDSGNSNQYAQRNANKDSPPYEYEIEDGISAETADILLGQLPSGALDNAEGVIVCWGPAGYKPPYRVAVIYGESMGCPIIKVYAVATVGNPGTMQFKGRVQSEGVVELYNSADELYAKIVDNDVIYFDQEKFSLECWICNFLTWLAGSLVCTALGFWAWQAAIICAAVHGFIAMYCPD